MTSIMDLMDKGGIILWIILVLSVTALALIIERILYFWNLEKREAIFYKEICASLEKKKYNEALSLAQASDLPLAKLAETGLTHRHHPRPVQKEMIAEKAEQILPVLERSISILGTISHISPLLGLLGTVTGNINAFGVMSQFGATGDPRMLAGGISEALITTAAGLIVSIPAVIFYNHFLERVKQILLRLDERVNIILGLFSKSSDRVYS